MRSDSFMCPNCYRPIPFLVCSHQFLKPFSPPLLLQIFLGSIDFYPFAMQSNPVDNIVCKVVAQLLKEKDVEYVSETVVTSIASIMMECRIHFGLRFFRYKRSWANGEHRSLFRK